MNMPRPKIVPIERHDPHFQCEISVIIPAFNAAATIRRALASVRLQNQPSLETIVVDDGSSDETIAIVEEECRQDPTVRLLVLDQNSGASAARNAGIRAARGKYLAFLDADDIWLAQKLEQQVAVLRQDDTVTLVSCNSMMTAVDGSPLKEGHVNRPPVQGAAAWKTLLQYNFLPTPTVVTRTQLVCDLGGFDVHLAVGEDLDLWIKLALLGKVVVLPDILINYYDLNNSLMKRHSSATGDIVLPMIERHLAEQGHNLSKVELRSIRGNRAFQTACDLYFSGNYLASIRLFLMAARCQVRPIKSIIYIPRAIVEYSIDRARHLFWK